MLRKISYFMAATSVATASLGAQAPVPDSVRRLADLAGLITRHGSALGVAIWPGYHPESIPTLYVIPHRAKLLVHWRDALLPGFQPLAGVRAAAWTDSQAVQLPSDRFIAFLSIDSAATAGDVLGLALHEAFHSFERKSRRDGHRFGNWENALLTVRYPVFDLDNETLFAVEGRLLRRAYEARRQETRTLACRYLDVRQRRQQALDTAFVTYEQLAELNEGLAQYALLRGEQELGTMLGGRFPGDARAALLQETALLDSLVQVSARSVRRRFYATGATEAMLLDRMAGPRWKRDLASRDRTVQQELEAVAHCPTDQVVEDSLELWTRAMRPVAAQAIADLKARRRAQAESLLTRPGRRVALLATYVPGHHFEYCGFDPQNLLPAGDGRTLHMRFVVLCSDSTSATIQTGAVEDDSGAVRAVLDASHPWTVTARGSPVTLPDSGALDLVAVRIESPAFSFAAPHATLAVTADEVRIIPRP